MFVSQQVVFVNLDSGAILWCFALSVWTFVGFGVVVVVVCVCVCVCVCMCLFICCLNT